MVKVTSSIEGPISKIQSDGRGGAIITAVGVKVVFTPNITGSNHPPLINTPTRILIPLTVDELLDTSSLPGREGIEGFTGGTVIAEGEYDTDARVLVANSIKVEPGETVLSGALTRNNPAAIQDLAINEVPVLMLTDKRMPANRKRIAEGPIYYNQYMLPMDINSALLATAPGGLVESIAEGYYAADPNDASKQVFHAFHFEYGGTGTLLENPETVPQISIERAPKFRDRGAAMEVVARGALTTHHITGTAPVQRLKFTITDEDGHFVELPGNIQLRFDVPEAGYIRWRLRDRYNKVGNLGLVPVKLKVENVTASEFLGRQVADEIEAEFRPLPPPGA